MVVHAYYPLDPRVRREAHAATRDGYDVTVICLRDSEQGSREVIDGVTVRRLPLRHVAGASARRILVEYVTFTMLATIVLAADMLRHPYDSVHIHNPPDFLILAGLIPKMFGARLILDVHDLSSHMFRARFRGRWGRLLSRALQMVERYACRVSDAVLTVHEPYRQELVNNGVSPGKVVVVMNALDRSLLAGVADDAAARPDEFVLAYCGTVNEWYGLDLVLDALAALRTELPSARAMILGSGDALPALRTRAARHGLDDVLEMPGAWIAQDQALARVASASVGIIPNRPTELNRFALSTKLFEYVALGLPVVAARLETLRAHFEPDEITYFEPGDAESLASALSWVAAHPEQARQRTAKAQRRVARQYSWTVSSQRYLDVLGGRI